MILPRWTTPMPLDPSSAQSDASRRNGARSAGPVTPEGLARSSRNATRWNLTGLFRLLPGEDQELITDLRLTYTARHAPRDAAERHWVDEIVAAISRQRRLRAIEAQAHAALEAGLDLAEARLPGLATLARYRARIARDLRLAQAQLEELRQSRPSLGREVTVEQLGYLLQIAMERRDQERAKASPPPNGPLPANDVGPAADPGPAAQLNRHERRRREAIQRRQQASRNG